MIALLITPIFLYNSVDKVCWDVSNKKEPILVIRYKLGATKNFKKLGGDYYDEEGNESSYSEYQMLRREETRYKVWGGGWCDANDGFKWKEK